MSRAKLIEALSDTTKTQRPEFKRLMRKQGITNPVKMAEQAIGLIDPSMSNDHLMWTSLLAFEMEMRQRIRLYHHWLEQAQV